LKVGTCRWYDFGTDVDHLADLARICPCCHDRLRDVFQLPLRHRLGWSVFSRQCLALAVAATVLLGHTTAAAQKMPAEPTRNPLRAMMAQLGAPDLASSAVARRDLAAGSLQLRIANTTAGQRVPVDRTDFIDLVVRNASSMQSETGRVFLATRGLEITRVEADGIKARPSIGGKVILLGEIAPNDEQLIVVEVKHTGTATGATTANSVLGVALSADAGAVSAREHAMLVWPLADPARDYHRSLAELDKKHGPAMYAALKTARRGLDDLPGRWIFKPVPRRPKRAFRTETRTVRKRVCTRYRRATRKERRKARRLGRRARKTCIRRVLRTTTRKVRIPIAQKGAVVDAKELRILELAFNAVKSRGAAPLMRKAGGRYGWTVTRLAVDLRTYMRQAPHPALCTGAQDYLDYLESVSVGFRMRAKEMHEARHDAPARAATHIRRLRRLLQEQQGGHPAVGAAPLAVLTPFPEDADVLMTLQELATTVVTLTVAESAAREMAAAADMLAALETAKTHTDDDLFRAHPGAVRRAARRVLSLIEASYYLRMGDDHYTRVETALYGGIDRIRKAHGGACIQGS